MFKIKLAEKIKIHILRPVVFFPENLAVFEIITKNMVEPEGPQMTSQYGGGCIHTHTRARAHTKNCVILLAFSRQQRLREGASVLRHMCITSLVKISTGLCNFITHLHTASWQTWQRLAAHSVRTNALDLYLPSVYKLHHFEYQVIYIYIYILISTGLTYLLHGAESFLRS